MKIPKKSHQRYTTSFKLAAVRLAEHENIQTQDVTVALDIHPFMLSRWKKEYRDGVLKGAVEKTHNKSFNFAHKKQKHGPYVLKTLY